MVRLQNIHFLHFLFHNLTIKQAVENASGYWDTRLAPLRLTSQVEQITLKRWAKHNFMLVLSTV